MLIKFTKMHGIGNDFVVIDNTLGQFVPNIELIKNWANRHTGIGFDQLLLVGLATDKANDFSYTIYNCDGSKATQCGNGARCIALFIKEKGMSAKKDLLVETQRGLIKIHDTLDGLFSVNMGKPIFLDGNHRKFIEQDYIEEDFLQTIYIEANKKIKVFNVDVGNRHTVVFVDNDVREIDVQELGSKIQKKSFDNVEFVQILSRNWIRIRVFESGAGETLACGTGACAAVVAGIKCGFLNNDVTVYLKGGKLNISWQLDEDIIMTGPAKTVFDGEINIDEDR